MDKSVGGIRRKFLDFILRVNTNYGSHIKLVVETFDIPCRGNNGLKIIDTSRNNRIESVNFCSKQRDSKVPMFVSTEVSFDLLLTIDSPLPVSSWLIVSNSYQTVDTSSSILTYIII